MLQARRRAERWAQPHRRRRCLQTRAPVGRPPRFQPPSAPCLSGRRASVPDRWAALWGAAGKRPRSGPGPPYTAERRRVRWRFRHLALRVRAPQGAHGCVCATGAVCGAATVACHKHLPPPGHIATHLPRARTVAAVPNMLAHAWRTTLFTVKGLTKFMKDGYESHAARFDPRCVARHPRCRVLLPCCVCAGQAGRIGALPQLVARQPLRLHLRAVRRDCRGGVPRAMELTSKSRLCGCTRESCRCCRKAR